MTTICFSLVLYKHSIECVDPLFFSILSLARREPRLRVLLCIYDGSPCAYQCPSEEQLRRRLYPVNVIYEKGDNLGFGRANNRNFYSAPLGPGDLFAIVNPDIRFSADQLLPLVNWLLCCSDCACAAPLILLEGGGIQYSAKRDPTLLSLFLGRFGWLKRVDVFRLSLIHI